ncbi:hypothetical protein Csa_018387 [Cucumis sativus]|nr:hypothetical protein Csa_018387 [Cucumis sativus]
MDRCKEYCEAKRIPRSGIVLRTVKAQCNMSDSYSRPLRINQLEYRGIYPKSQGSIKQQDLFLVRLLSMQLKNHPSYFLVLDQRYLAPKGIGVLDPREIPFLNTPIHLSFGAAVTWAHHAILAGKEKRVVYALVATVSLALVFTGFQGMEYYQAPFTISDSIYGSTFFLATSFHGFHVIIGTLFLIVCGIRQYLGHLTKEHHIGFEAAAWYWHFVDVVRLFLFVSIYWWGGIEEIMADHVHQEMTRNWILVYLRFFLFISIKDLFLSLISFPNQSKNLMDSSLLAMKDIGLAEGRK